MARARSAAPVESDPEWMNREVSRISSDLRSRYDTVPPGIVERTVHSVAAQLSASAKILTFLPVLIRRRAETELRQS